MVDIKRAKFVLSFVFPIILFLFLELMGNFSLIPKGIVLRQWQILKDGARENVTLPDYTRIETPTVRCYEARIIGPYKGYLVLARPNGQALWVFIDGVPVFQVGDRDTAANIWTYSFIVPVDVGLGFHKIRIELLGSYDIGFMYPPYLSKDPWLKVMLGNIMYSTFYGVAMGIALGFFILLLILGLSLKYNRRVYIYIALSSLFTALYLTDFIFREFSGSLDAYTFSKRIFYSLTYLSILFLYGGMEKRVGKSKIFPYFFAASIVVIIIIMAIPSFPQAREFHLKALLLLLFMLAATIVQAFLTRDLRYIWPFFFLGIVITHDVWALAFDISNLMISGYGVIVTGIALSIILVEDYRNLYSSMVESYERSISDHLTGAYSRGYLNELRVDERSSLIFMDLDNFKRLNDKKGHDYGDKILRTLVETIKENIRRSDAVVRYGGDEFALVLKNCSPEHAEEVAQRILEDFKAETGEEFSYGVSSCNEGLKNALIEADKRMYEMKRRKGVLS